MWRGSDGGSVTVGVYVGPGSTGWERVLEQEGLPYAATAEPDHPITVSGGPIPPWTHAYVTAGGVLVVSGAEPTDDLLPRPVLATIQQVLPPDRSHWAAAPCLAWLYPDEGTGEVRLHEDRVTKDRIVQDRYPLVARRRVGRGSIIYTGVPLTTLLDAAGDRLRAFSEFTDVTERVASIDKAELTDVLVGMLQRAFTAHGMPYVRLCRFPDGAASVLLLRVDVDGAFGARAKRLAAVAADFDVEASFYINGTRCEADPGDLTGWPGNHELGHHGYVHNLFDSEAENRANLERGAAWVAAQTGRRPRSFVAPRGLWNESLDRALAAGGYGYSSDFSIDFDSLPFRTAAGVLQVPVHPYSPERATVYAEQHGLRPPTPDTVRDYYVRVIQRQVERRRQAHVYGHPEVLGAMADDVLPTIFATARELRIPSLTLGAFASWWSEREKAGMRLRWDGQRGRMHVSFDSDGPWHVEFMDTRHDEAGTVGTERGSATRIDHGSEG